MNRRELFKLAAASIGAALVARIPLPAVSSAVDVDATMHNVNEQLDDGIINGNLAYTVNYQYGGPWDEDVAND